MKRQVRCPKDKTKLVEMEFKPDGSLDLTFDGRPAATPQHRKNPKGWDELVLTCPKCGTEVVATLSRTPQ
jgi:hypothetical protein